MNCSAIDRSPAIYACRPGASAEGLKDAIRTAIGYGYPVEAVAAAGSMSVDDVTAIAEGSAAA